jgi:cytochrome c peroxidase
MSLVNVAYSPAFTWGDSRVRSLEAQMRTPLFDRHPLEMGVHIDGRELSGALSQDAEYGAQFAAAFPADRNAASISNTIKAIAAFERTLISGRSAFDRYVFSDDTEAMSESAKRGMKLFYSTRIGCSECHSGINFSGPLLYQTHEKATALFANNGLYRLNARGDYPHTDRGLIEVTHRPADMGKFRVPTLRNIALTGPYMHDGSIDSLQQVLDHYSRGGSHNPHQDRRVKPTPMTAEERADLLGFLDSLTDREFVTNPQFRP